MAQEETLVSLEPLVHLVHQDALEPLEGQVPLVVKEHQVAQVPLGRGDQLDQLVPEDSMEKMVNLGVQVYEA